MVPIVKDTRDYRCSSFWTAMNFVSRPIDIGTLSTHIIGHLTAKILVLR